MKIHIGSLDYDVVFVKNFDDDTDEQISLGKCDEPLCKITINNAFPKQTMQQTFWHEVLHAMMMELGQTDLYNNETFIDTMAKQLHMFFKRNDIKKIYEKFDG